ncbi:MAG: tRNA (adenosine(37)-N6)-threonylcarbamoyltransferase complex dimerization subunit type 1 TsaB [Planctomycetota bacterium]|jgi:tRNA threonylcarbamoyladenosine biosynthesis protein TsaB
MAESELILAVETSSRIGSVALARGAELLAEATFSAPLKHSAEIFPAVSDLLARFEHKPDRIEQVYISGGPGSFTGLRIAATLAKTMYLASGVQIVSVDTLDIVAANVISLTGDDAPGGMPHTASRERVATIVDAKRGQFFVAVYERSPSGTDHRAETGAWTKVLLDCLMRPEQFIEGFAGRDSDIWLLGDGLVYYKDKFQAEGVRFFDEQFWSPRAVKVYLLGRQLAARGEFSDPLTLVPNYLRRPDVKIKT